jgi:hypothetical protein
MQNTELVVTAILSFTSGGFHIFNEKFISRFFGNESFGV